MQLELLANDGINKLESPGGYKGLAAFHKYWGKKPVECLDFLIEVLTSENDLIVDPFVGSGLISRESIIKNRRFIGIDINPIAIEMSLLLSELPNPISLKSIFSDIELKIRDKINKTYKMADGRIATHYLWDGETLKSVWFVKKGRNGREELEPNQSDVDLHDNFKYYKPTYPRSIKLFHNSRVNSTETLTLSDLFTGRALYNIDILLKEIYNQPEYIKRALLLSLTSASGQMSKMVFAITGRGKTKGLTSKKVEVGSWVIGYWRPKLHFEINVWNCFHKRVNNLINAISCIDIKMKKSQDIQTVITGEEKLSLVNGDAIEILDSMPSESVSLILTDPPHSDRIPYLELSEMWNSFIGKDVDFDREIVVSNARGRTKTKAIYSAEMSKFVKSATRILKAKGFLTILFNARDIKSWEFVQKIFLETGELSYIGSFPMTYSANSVVQDNREGSLKKDYVLIFQKDKNENNQQGLYLKLEKLSGWSYNIPTETKRL